MTTLMLSNPGRKKKRGGGGRKKLHGAALAAWKKKRGLGGGGKKKRRSSGPRRSTALARTGGGGGGTRRRGRRRPAGFMSMRKRGGFATKDVMLATAGTVLGFGTMRVGAMVPLPAKWKPATKAIAHGAITAGLAAGGSAILYRVSKPVALGFAAGGLAMVAVGAFGMLMAKLKAKGGGNVGEVVEVVEGYGDEVGDYEVVEGYDEVSGDDDGIGEVVEVVEGYDDDYDAEDADGVEGYDGEVGEVVEYIQG